jgi:hypothetical protein
MSGLVLDRLTLRGSSNFPTAGDGLASRNRNHAEAQKQ